MKLSKIASEIAELPTFALNEEARLLRERGEAVIHLGIGEPKNKTPINAILTSAAKLTSGEVKYTPPDGVPSLKKAVVRYTEENYDRLVAPENVIVTNGAKQGLFNIFYSILNSQDEVIVIAPYWVSYPEIIRMCLGRPVIVTPEDGTFTPRFEDIERAVTSYTRAIIVNSPNNPSGAIYPPALIEKLVDFCERKGIFLICDDIYHKLTFDHKEAIPAIRYAEKGCRRFACDYRQWRCKALRYDRLPGRMGCCAARTNSRDDQCYRPDHFRRKPRQPGGGRRSA